MDAKLKEILDGLGITIEQLNSNSPQEREAARVRLSQGYANARIVFANKRDAKLRNPQVIDGVRSEYPTYPNLTARGFANSATALNDYLFVSFADLASLVKTGETMTKMESLSVASTIPSATTSVVMPENLEGIKPIDEVDDDKGGEAITKETPTEKTKPNRTV